jgi:hypothetical protein
MVLLSPSEKEPVVQPPRAELLNGMAPSPPLPVFGFQTIQLPTLAP